MYIKGFHFTFHQSYINYSKDYSAYFNINKQYKQRVTIADTKIITNCFVAHISAIRSGELNF